MDEYIKGQTVSKVLTGYKESGEPVAPVGLTVAVYADGDLSSPITPNGLSLSVAGGPASSNIALAIDTAQAGYETGEHQYAVIATGGTVEGVSIAGDVLYQFGLGRVLTQADIGLVYSIDRDVDFDVAAEIDRYTVRWRKNNVLLLGGEVTNPLIEIRSRDNTELVAETTMVAEGSGIFTYDSVTLVPVGGKAVVTVKATIDGAVRIEGFIRANYD